MELKLDGITKEFHGFTAVDQVSCRMRNGVYGLLGVNGAGKTTVIKHLAGFVLPDFGTVTIDGQSVIDNEELKQKVLIIPDELYFFRGYSLKDMRGFYKNIYKRWDEERFNTMVDDFGIDLKKNMGNFSKGVRKQAAFCLAMAATPDYLILDEPVDGLDPIVRRKLWRYVMGDVAERRMTVLISSHNAREMEDVCDYIGILAGGNMVFEGDLLELMPVSVEELFIEKLGGGGR